MRKVEIAEHIVSNTTLTKSQAIEAVDLVFEAISKSLSKGESVYVRGFGTFKAYTTKERNGRNISKGTTVRIPARRSAKLIVGKQLKDVMTCNDCYL